MLHLFVHSLVLRVHFNRLLLLDEPSKLVDSGIHVNLVDQNDLAFVKARSNFLTIYPRV